MSGEKETIQALVEAKFSFETLCPQPIFPPIDISGEDDRWYHWRNEHWGSKWDRYEYDVVKEGPRGLIVKFTTAWSPPYAFFESLLKKYPDLWLHCDWREEGGMAGVFVGCTKDKVEIQSMEWQDWCMEEGHYLFAARD
jgi:hypothetical protein